MTDAEGNQYLTPSQVAEVLHVTSKTVSRWAAQGLLPCLLTLGGHRRFRGEVIEEIRRRMARREYPLSGLDVWDLESSTGCPPLGRDEISP